ncbi:MOSC domain-containing protein [Hespellia stercorisuis]|uniref:Molybdenum cofactor synthesis domain-containing protein n=1 Tax=Hespellia stercorisuis DSM 15480 TaxID=1121950 RepID=A0A1M6LVW5_9FIRM|nr:MOSC domain-containing protein [Hespellia stercorisuis]SHJ75367.1 molybdenum cofactor synthesis domain-containing protein [Hespellia stercorisuis DSM 15480]
MGVVKAVCTSDRRGIQKTDVTSAQFQVGFGIVGDAHGGNWHRQVSLLSYEKVEAFNEKGADVGAGAFGENLVVEGFDFRNLPVGTVFRCNDVVLEMTQIGKECHTHCQIYQKMGECIMPTQGVFAEVRHGGSIRVGDEMVIVPEMKDPRMTAAVVTLSDKGAKGEREDKSGPLIKQMLEDAGYRVIEKVLIPDELERIKIELMRLADGRQANLIITTGGTGFSPRDCTPEATMAVATRNAPGIAEAIRAFSMTITDRAMLSREVSVIRNQTLIVNLPGSPKAVSESLGFVLPSLKHGLDILTGADAECARS